MTLTLNFDHLIPKMVSLLAFHLYVYVQDKSHNFTVTWRLKPK